MSFTTYNQLLVSKRNIEYHVPNFSIVWVMKQNFIFEQFLYGDYMFP